MTDTTAQGFIRAAQWPNDVAGRLMCTLCTLADGHDYRAHYCAECGKYHASSCKVEADWAVAAA